MARMSRDDFKRAVLRAFEERDYTRVKVSMSLFGLQCDVKFRRDGMFGRQKAHGRLRERDGKRYVAVEEKNGAEWQWEIPD